MTTLIWKLHRRQAGFALAALAALGILLVITGTVMAHDYSSFMAHCHATQSCDQAGGILFQGDGAIIDVVNATVIVPLLFGVFWGAPLLASEYETGTQHLAWTQGVTRRRWLGSNLLAVFGAAALWAAAMTVLVSWWRAPENALDSRFTSFDIQGLVPIAYACFAVALGVLLGTAIRRILPAMAATLAGFAAVRILVGVYLRPHLLPPLTAAAPLLGRAVGPPGAWILSASLAGPHGILAGGLTPGDIPAACRSASPLLDKGALPQCLAAHGFHSVVTYQPAGRFWAFQGMESAIFVLLAVALVAVAWRLVLTRDA